MVDAISEILQAEGIKYLRSRELAREILTALSKDERPIVMITVDTEGRLVRRAELAP